MKRALEALGIKFMDNAISGPIGALAEDTKGGDFDHFSFTNSSFATITGERGHFWNDDRRIMTIRLAILGLALLLAMIGDSAGQSVPEPPRQISSGGQQQTNTEQRDTDQAPPSAIKILPSEQTQAKPTEDEQNGQRTGAMLGLSVIKSRSSQSLPLCFSLALSLSLYLQ